MTYARTVLGVFLVLVVAIDSGAHGYPEPAPIELHGEIVDLHCYLQQSEKAIGEAHAACARRCLEQGQPMGLLEDDGTLWVLSAWHLSSNAFDTAKQMAGRRVVVEGIATERQGLHALELRRVSRDQTDEQKRGPRAEP